MALARGHNNRKGAITVEDTVSLAVFRYRVTEHCFNAYITAVPEEYADKERNKKFKEGVDMNKIKEEVIKWLTDYY